MCTRRARARSPTFTRVVDETMLVGTVAHVRGRLPYTGHCFQTRYVFCPIDGTYFGFQRENTFFFSLNIGRELWRNSPFSWPTYSAACTRDGLSSSFRTNARNSTSQQAIACRIYIMNLNVTRSRRR